MKDLIISYMNECSDSNLDSLKQEIQNLKAKKEKPKILENKLAKLKTKRKNLETLFKDFGVLDIGNVTDPNMIFFILKHGLCPTATALWQLTNDSNTPNTTIESIYLLLGMQILMNLKDHSLVTHSLKLPNVRSGNTITVFSEKRSNLPYISSMMNCNIQKYYDCNLSTTTGGLTHSIDLLNYSEPNTQTVGSLLLNCINDPNFQKELWFPTSYIQDIQNAVAALYSPHIPDRVDIHSKQILLPNSEGSYDNLIITESPSLIKNFKNMLGDRSGDSRYYTSDEKKSVEYQYLPANEKKDVILTDKELKKMIDSGIPEGELNMEYKNIPIRFPNPICVLKNSVFSKAQNLGLLSQHINTRHLIFTPITFNRTKITDVLHDYSKSKKLKSIAVEIHDAILSGDGKKIEYCVSVVVDDIRNILFSVDTSNLPQWQKDWVDYVNVEKDKRIISDEVIDRFVDWFTGVIPSEGIDLREAWIRNIFEDTIKQGVNIS